MVKSFLLELLITAHKRSLGQGNVFTPVCHSVHRGKGDWLPSMHHMTRGVCIQGVSCIGGLHPGSWEGLHLGGLHRGEGGLGRPHPVPQDMVNKQAVRILLECKIFLLICISGELEPGTF